jgi:hypothetical protein
MKSTKSLKILTEILHIHPFYVTVPFSTLAHMEVLIEFFL